MADENEAGERGRPGTLVRIAVVLVLIFLVPYTFAKLSAPTGCTVIHMKGPLSGGQAPSLTYDPSESVITVEGSDITEIEHAADRLAIALLGITGQNYTLSLRSDIRTYKVPVPVKTVEGGTAILWFELLSNPSRLDTVAIEGGDELATFIAGKPARFAFAFHPYAGGEVVRAATEVSRALVVAFPHLNTSTDLITFDDASNALTLVTAKEACR